jgi:hypothetical protein
VKPRARQRTPLGSYFVADAREFLEGGRGQPFKGRVQLLLTSPPFPLNRKKSYGNLEGREYKRWFSDLAPLFAEYLTDDGSIVVELGNAWMSGRPIQSLLPLESLLGFVKNKEGGLRLCQQFICHNPSRLPSPAQWVTVERIRTTDSFTHVWWMAKSDFPKADNRKVLRPYSKSMRKLLRRGSYNDGARPSQHRISKKGFLRSHRGSIMPSVLELEAIERNTEVRLPSVMRFSNSNSNDFFLRACRERGISPHPARMPSELAAFFIQFLTDPGDLVLDPFAGSNTTGFVAEVLGREWVSIEAEAKYAEQSRIRFLDPRLKASDGKGAP